MKVVFVRHGESTANTGLRSTNVASIQLTEHGHSQARTVATEWAKMPSLIVTSPFLRTKQTAAPTIARFAGVPVESWPIEEFTYLDPARWNGTTSAERRPHVERYWANSDPGYRDGEEAESFSNFLRRVDSALARLAAMPTSSLAYVFGHGQFIQASLSVVMAPGLDDRAQMRAFWNNGAPRAIANAERVALAWDGVSWACVETVDAY